MRAAVVSSICVAAVAAPIRKLPLPASPAIGPSVPSSIGGGFAVVLPHAAIAPATHTTRRFMGSRLP